MVVREEQSEPQVSSLGDWMAPLLGGDWQEGGFGEIAGRTAILGLSTGPADDLRGSDNYNVTI